MTIAVRTALQVQLVSLAFSLLSATAQAQIGPADEPAEAAPNMLADFVAEHSLLAIGIVVLLVFAAGAVAFTIGRNSKN